MTAIIIYPVTLTRNLGVILVFLFPFPQPIPDGLAFKIYPKSTYPSPKIPSISTPNPIHLYLFPRPWQMASQLPTHSYPPITHSLLYPQDLIWWLFCYLHLSANGGSSEKPFLTTYWKLASTPAMSPCFIVFLVFAVPEITLLLYLFSSYILH